MRLDAAALYVKEDGGVYVRVSGTVNENDPAVLSLRAWLTPLDLNGTGSALIGETAFPLRVRGELTGFLVAGHKLSAEAMAPDEREALALLAHNAGLALDSLRIADIERELALLRAGREGFQPQPAG